MLAFPPYTAVIESVPTLSVLAVNVGTLPLSVAAPIHAFPFLKVTDPVGVPDADDTVALKTTACP